MSTQQKSALYMLVVSLAAVAAYGVLLLRFGPDVALAGFAVMGLTGLEPLLFRRGTVDERDRLLTRKANMYAFGAYHLFIVGFCMLVWLVRFRADVPTIPVSLLPLLVWGSVAVMLIVRSAAILVLERRALDQAAA